MATDLTLSLPKRKIDWTGKLYESQLVAVAEKMRALSEALEERKAVLSQLNPTIADDELMNLVNQELVADLFSGKTLSLSLLVRDIIWSAFPTLRSQFVVVEDRPGEGDSGTSVLFTLDADEFLAIFEAIGAALTAFAPEPNEEKPKKATKPKANKGFDPDKSFGEQASKIVEESEQLAKLRVAQEKLMDEEESAVFQILEVNEEIAREEERSRKIAELRKQLDQLTEAPVPTEVA